MSDAASRSSTSPGMSGPARALTGPEKAAVVLLALGSEKSAPILSALAPREVAVVSRQLARMRPVDEDLRRHVLQEFLQAASAKTWGQ